MATEAYVSFTVPTMVQIPRTITPQTDPQTADHAVRAFYGVSYSWHNHQDGDGALATRDTIQSVMTALMDGTSVTLLYEDAKHDLTARTLYPSAVMLTEEHYVACKAYAPIGSGRRPSGSTGCAASTPSPSPARSRRRDVRTGAIGLSPPSSPAHPTTTEREAAMPYNQTALALDGAARPTAPPQAAPIPATATPKSAGGWAALLRHTRTPSGGRLPGDLWDEYRFECVARERLHLPEVGLAEFRDMRDWTDCIEEQEDDNNWITAPDTDPPPYGCIREGW